MGDMLAPVCFTVHNCINNANMSIYFEQLKYFFFLDSDTLVTSIIMQVVQQKTAYQIKHHHTFSFYEQCQKICRLY